MLKLIQISISTISNISPKLGAYIGYKMFQKVRKKDIRQREEVFYKQAKTSTLPFRKEDLNIYEFGNNSKDLVILVHGWDSNAGCMYKFIDGLTITGKKVFSLNLPGHANYIKDYTNLFECKEALKTLLNNLPEHDSLSIISHSFGSAVTTFALAESKIKVEKLIFHTSPNVIMDIFDDFKDLIKLGNKAYKLLISKADAILKEPVNGLKIESKLKDVEFKHLYLIHDKQDKIIPFKNSENIHAKNVNSTLITFNNVGHYRMLWNSEIIDKTIDIINNKL